MLNSVTVQINGEVFPIELDSSSIHTIREDDELSVCIRVDNSDPSVSVFFEDAEPDLQLTTESNEVVYRTPIHHYFSECFGQAIIRIYIEDVLYQIFFNVRAKKISAISAEKMIRYLASQHESIIRSCFSRSTHPIGSVAGPIADPESIITAAEAFTWSLLLHRSELMATRRTRLVPTRQPLWKSNRANCDIDPVDILHNLDAISPASNEGDIFLRGRHFSLEDIDVSALKETCDVFENQIVLGGLYSIRNKLQNLLDGLSNDSTTVDLSDGYESLERLLLTLTSVGMVARCNDVMARTFELIRIFELRLGVSYKGEIRPVMTPYARTSKVYRTLYAHLANWYELGSPSFGSNNFLMKLKSLSKIYELYSLFQIMDHMASSGWIGSQFKAHAHLGEHIPQEVTFTRENVVARIAYEPIIRPLSSNTASHLDLVDVVHRNPNADYNYWNPDYVIRLDTPNGKTKYLILDAKYSTESVVRNNHLPNVIEKYYWGMSVFDAEKNNYSNEHISGVLIIYPLGVNTKFVKYGRRLSYGSRHLPLPVVGAVSLEIDSPGSFSSVIDNVLNAIKIALN